MLVEVAVVVVVLVTVPVVVFVAVAVDEGVIVAVLVVVLEQAMQQGMMYKMYAGAAHMRLRTIGTDNTHDVELGVGVDDMDGEHGDNATPRKTLPDGAE